MNESQIEIGEDFLMHYGVKGMRWGVRRDRPDGVSARTNRQAKKDAEEFTKAKMFFGEGAGTRRKLIKATVEAKSARDPSYKKAFDLHVNSTDMSKRASQAKGQRRRKDVSNSTRKTIRGAIHIAKGNSQYASAAATVAVGGAMYLHKKGIDQMILKAGKQTLNEIRKSATNRQNMKMAADMLKKAGF